MVFVSKAPSLPPRGEEKERVKKKKLKTVIPY
jgi:hypothetical protein